MGAFSLTKIRKVRKTYFFLPPEEAVYTVTPIQDWLKENEGGERLWPHVLRCEQRAGDIMFIPGTYAHGVLNTRRTIGVATEIITRHSNHWTGRWD